MTGSARHAIGGYREYAPAPEAARFCEAFWTHVADSAATAGSAHRVLPDPAVSLAFRATRTPSGVVRDAAVVLIGPKTRAHVFPVEPGVEFAAVRLKLEWTTPLLAIDAGSIDDLLIDLAVLRPDIAGSLLDRLTRTTSATAALRVLATTVQDCASTSGAPRQAARAALELLRGSAGRMPLANVADTIGVSVRHLRRQVQDATAVAPKTYARALRLARAMRIADSSTTPAWADIAARAGYCDQSHLIREAIALAGAPPAHLHTERRLQRVSAAERSNTV